ncbi:hypothetical protein ACI8AF_07330 [Blastococcus sp. SYSU D00669]
MPGDDFLAFVAGGWVEPWLPEAHEQDEVVLQAAAAAAGRLARGGYAAACDGVVGPWLLPAFAAATGQAELACAVLLRPGDECLRRVATRTGHGFTDAGATRRMHRQFAAAGLDPRHVPTDTGPASALASAVLDRLAAGTLRCRS